MNITQSIERAMNLTPDVIHITRKSWEKEDVENMHFLRSEVGAHGLFFPIDAYGDEISPLIPYNFSLGDLIADDWFSAFMLWDDEDEDDGDEDREF